MKVELCSFFCVSFFNIKFVFSYTTKNSIAISVYTLLFLQNFILHRFFYSTVRVLSHYAHAKIHSSYVDSLYTGNEMRFYSKDTIIKTETVRVKRIDFIF